MPYKIKFLTNNLFTKKNALKKFILALINAYITFLKKVPFDNKTSVHKGW